MSSREQTPVACPFRGVPSFFRGCCSQASQAGGASYRLPGYHLAIHLDSLVSHGYEDEALFGERLAYLEALMADNRRADVLRWLLDEYPSCMRLVPRRRRQVFLDGVFEAFEAERMEFAL